MHMIHQDVSTDVSHTHRCLEEDPTFIATETPDVLASLFPDATTRRLVACRVDTTTVQVTILVRSTQASVPCPLCTIPTRRIHSRYERPLADLP
jgi:hypothetical protein